MSDTLLSHQHLLTADDLNYNDIQLIFNKAKFYLDNYKPGTKYDDLKGMTVALAFFENSTRTRLSFELAAKRLSGDVFSFAAAQSSLSKGESLVDTIRTIEAMGVQMYVIRHQSSGVPLFITQNTKGLVINAGDGKHEHPTQGLLDAFTLLRYFGELKGLKVCIIGDILNSRVARSNIVMLNTLGVEVAVFGPGTLFPTGIEQWNVKMLSSIEEAIEWSNVLLLLRLQRERMESGMLPTLREYSNYYGINLDRFNSKPELILLHPGPVNYGVELEYEVSFNPNVLIETQVTHGVYIRMALLALLSKHVKV